MGLSGKQSSGERSPYFIKEATIIGIDVEYNKETNDGKTKDIDLVATVVMDKKDGGTFESKLYLSGNYKKDMRGELTGSWGSAFPIRHLINMCGIEDFDTDDNGVIPDSVWQTIIEKKPKVLVLSYASKQGEKGIDYRKYKIVHTDRKKLEEQFLKDVNGQYPPYEYNPHLVEEGGKAAPTSNDEVPF